MSSLSFPPSSNEFTPEFFTAVLSEFHPGVRVCALDVLEEAHCNTGSASTAARAVLELDYEAGHDEGLPRRVLLKTVLVRPGAPSSLYRNEVRFYRKLRPEVAIETPRAYASLFDEASGTFGVVMEDVRLRSARFPNATQSMSAAEIEDALTQLAALHAHFWESPRFSTDLAWLWTPRSGGFYDFLSAGGYAFIQELIHRSDYKQALIERVGRSFDELWAALWKAQEILDSEPATLLHGDTHLGNTYLLPNGRAGLLDWQLMNRGQWAHDVTYLLVTALDTDVRRKCERDLLDHYLEQLRSRGVSSTPSREAAWLLYRQAAIWGFLIGWMICPTENYGEEILQANLERLISAVEDLETFAALPG